MLATLAQRRLAMAAHLNHLLGRPSHHEVGRPEPVALSPLPFSPEELVLIADAQQPELLASRFALERAAAELKLAKWELLPDLETMFELRNPAMGPVGPWDLALAVTLPFWFWTKARYGVKVAVADRDSARAAAQAMQNEVQKRIHEHWHEAFAAWKTARLSLDGLLPLAEQAVASAFAAYRSGRGSVMDLLDALRRLGGRRRTYYQELVAFEQHVVMLEQASGIPLREEGR
jgi:outer membrane protein TolC